MPSKKSVIKQINLKTAKKLSASILISSVIVLTADIFILFSNASKIDEKVHNDFMFSLQEFTHLHFSEIKNINKAYAITLASNPTIQKALETNNRLLALDEINRLIKRNHLKNFKVHIHTKDNHSFLRNWKSDKFGDDLSGFRKSVVEVNKNLKPISTFELGRVGLSLRYVIPVFNNDNKHIGSLEFIQSLDSIEKAFEEKGQFVIFLVNNEKVKSIKLLDSARSIQDKYIAFQQYINPQFLQSVRNLDFDIIFSNGHVIDNKYFFTFVEITDFQDEVIGIALVGENIAIVNYTIEAAKELIYISLAVMIFMVVSTVIFMEIVSRKIIIYPLNAIKDGLDSFFDFMKREKTSIDKLDENLSAEFGEIAKDVNQNILTISEILQREEEHKKELIEMNNRVKQLLDNAEQGFLYFNSSMIIGEQYSKVAGEIFDIEIHGENIIKLLYPNDPEKQLYNTSSLKSILKKNGLRQELMLSLLDREFVINDRFIEIDYKVLDKNNYMLILTDYTEQKELDEKIKEEQQVLKMVVEIVISYEQFMEIRRDYENFSEKIEDYKSVDMLPELRREIHTYKGLFAQKEMLNIVKKLHNFENDIIESIKHDKLNNVVSEITPYQLQQWLELDLSILKYVLGEDYFEHSDRICIEKSRLLEILEQVQDNRVLKREITKLTYHNIKIFFRPYEKLVVNLAKRLEKRIFPLELDAENIYVSDRYKPFLNSLVHIYRNSVDHGIEDPDTREEKEKLRYGTIKTKIFENEDNQLIIIISDDGAGIDVKKIANLAVQRGIVSEDEVSKLSEDEIIRFIFKDEFSTAKEVTEISGRGVGLSSVLSELDKLNGNMKIDNRFGEGITFTFSFNLV